MDITIHQSYLPQDDPDAALSFWRDTLGFEVRGDVGYNGMRWITVGGGVSPRVYRRRAARAPAGLPPCVAKLVTKPICNR